MDVKEYLKQLEDLVNIDCGSHNAEGITKVADYLEALYRNLGWNIVRHDLGPKTGPLLEISNHKSDHYDVMMIGHMDTVFPDGTVAERPFRSDGVKAYGPGVADMKNGCLAMYHVAKNADPKVLDSLDICMVYNPDEEIGSVYSRDAVDEIARRTDYVYVMESCGPGEGTHCIARKGSLGYEFEFEGIAGHAGYIFDRPNASAILEMAHYTVELMGLISRERNTTVNVGVIEGGTAANVVPDYAKLAVEMRMFTQDERQRVMARVEELMAKPFVEGVKVRITKHRSSPPFERTERAERYIEHVSQIAAAKGIPFSDKDRGGLSDANHIAACDVICVDAMGPLGGDDHGIYEYTVIDSVVYCVDLICAMLEDLSQNK